MVTFVAIFDAPQDVSASGLDGRAIRFPFTAVEDQYIGTPRQASHITHGSITVTASGSLLAVWGSSDLSTVKALFQIAKEHLEALLENSGGLAGDIFLSINSQTHPGPCPFDITLIQEPLGAVVKLEVTRPIGFL